MDGSSENESEQDTTEEQTLSIPDGGCTAWFEVAASFCLLLNSFGLTNSFGVFQTYYYHNLLADFSYSAIAWIGSIQAFLLISLGVVTGPIYDYGHRRALVVVGSVLSIFGMLMTGLCEQYWQLLLAQGICVGMGAGCLFLPSIACLPQYFEKRRAFATGIGSSGSAIGGIIFPIVFNHLQPRIGFKYATWLMALIMLVTLIIPVIALRMRQLPQKARRIFDARALREWAFVLWGVYLFVSLLGLYLPSFFIQLYGLKFASENTAFQLLPVLNAGSFFGRLLPLYFADKVGPLDTEIVVTAVGAVLCFSWIAVQSISGLFVFSAIYGFFAGAITTVTAPIDAELCPSLDVIGVRTGMLLLPWAIGLLVGEPIAGAILGSSGNWLGLQIFAGSVLSFATIIAVAVRAIRYSLDFRIRSKPLSIQGTTESSQRR